MDDVTDTVFRQIIESCAPADLYLTEFVNVDGLQSPGRERLLPKLRKADSETNLIAQVWGKTPDNFYEIAKQIADGTILDEINLDARRSRSDEVQGNKGRQESRMDNTVKAPRTRVTPQFAESSGSVSSSAGKQDTAARTSGGFAGIDINFGCPEKNIVRNKTCSAFILPENRGAAVEIIKAVQAGVGGRIPVSVKTRLGFNEVDLSWHELLLQQELNMLTIHGRTRKQMSKVPADWEMIAKVRELRDKLSPATLIVGNGDVLDHAHAEELAKKYDIDGVMIGRGIFTDPFIFAEKSPWLSFTKEQRIALFKRHVELFAKTWIKGERRFDTLKKFAKVYISDFDGASELRAKIMECRTSEEVLAILD